MAHSLDMRSCVNPIEDTRTSDMYVQLVRCTLQVSHSTSMDNSGSM